MANRFKLLSKLMEAAAPSEEKLIIKALNEAPSLENINQRLIRQQERSNPFQSESKLKALVEDLDQKKSLQNLTDKPNFDEPIRSGTVDLSEYPGDTFKDKLKAAVKSEEKSWDKDEVISASKAAMYRGMNQNTGAGLKRQQDALSKSSRFEELKNKLGIK